MESRKRTVTPDESTLGVERRTDAIEAIAFVSFAQVPVLLVNVLRALTRAAGAHLGQVALVGCIATHVALRSQLQYGKIIAL